MKEQDLVNLGFKKQEVSKEVSGDKDYFYYYFDINNLCFITQANDEVKDDNWYVYLFEENMNPISSKEDLTDLINILKKYEVSE